MSTRTSLQWTWSSIVFRHVMVIQSTGDELFHQHSVHGKLFSSPTTTTILVSESQKTILKQLSHYHYHYHRRRRRPRCQLSLSFIFSLSHQTAFVCSNFKIKYNSLLFGARQPCSVVHISTTAERNCYRTIYVTIVQGS